MPQYLPNSTACRLYLIVILLQTGVNLAIEADILIQFDDLKGNTQVGRGRPGIVQSLPIYLSIFALGQYVLYHSI